MSTSGEILMTQEINEQDELSVSLGKKLSQRRKVLGLTEQQIANHIHVRTTIIQDIENDKEINVPAVFYKGYIKNYAAFVGLPSNEYEAYLYSKTSKSPIQKMKNYSNKEQKKRNSKRIVIISLFIILIIITVSIFFIWKDSQSEFVEITHYVSPTNSINS